MKRKKMNNEPFSLFIFLMCYDELFAFLWDERDRSLSSKRYSHVRWKACLCLVAILSRRHAYMLFKELSQETLVGKVEQFGDVFNALCSGFEQHTYLHDDVIVDPFVRCSVAGSLN